MVANVAAVANVADFALISLGGVVNDAAFAVVIDAAVELICVAAVDYQCWLTIYPSWFHEKKCF